MTSLTANYLAETTIAQMEHEHIAPFTEQAFTDFWYEGELGDAVREHEFTHIQAAQLLSDAWHLLPATAKA